MEGLLNLDRPHRTRPELCPFDHWTGDVPYVLHGAHVHQTVFDERRYAIIHLPRADGRYFERWPQPVNQEANGTPVIGSPKQFDHRLRWPIAMLGRRQRAIAPAHNPHSSVH